MVDNTSSLNKNDKLIFNFQLILFMQDPSVTHFSHFITHSTLHIANFTLLLLVIKHRKALDGGGSSASVFCLDKLYVSNFRI